MSTKNFWKQLPRPIVGLAPMDGYSDSAFRRVCKRINPRLITVTEFTSADGLHHNAKRLRKKLEFHPSEQPVIAQIFGKNVDTFISATKLCEDMGFSGIDLNMGCPSKRVVKSEHGVALRRKKDLAYQLIEAVAGCTPLPVSVKTRLGWSNADDLIEFGLGAQHAGANMICIHARTYKEPYNVPPQFDPVIALKKALDIPVIGNGGIRSVSEGIQTLSELDGFYIGQASFGNPWVFSETEKPLSFQEKVPVILDHARWLIESKGEEIGCREIRKHLLSYTKGFPGAKEARSKLTKVASYQEIESVFDYLATHVSG